MGGALSRVEPAGCEAHRHSSSLELSHQQCVSMVLIAGGATGWGQPRTLAAQRPTRRNRNRRCRIASTESKLGKPIAAVVDGALGDIELDPLVGLGDAQVGGDNGDISSGMLLCTGRGPVGRRRRASDWLSCRTRAKAVWPRALSSPWPVPRRRTMVCASRSSLNRFLAWSTDMVAAGWRAGGDGGSRS